MLNGGPAAFCGGWSDYPGEVFACCMLPQKGRQVSQCGRGVWDTRKSDGLPESSGHTSGQQADPAGRSPFEVPGGGSGVHSCCLFGRSLSSWRRDCSCHRSSQALHCRVLLPGWRCFRSFLHREANCAERCWHRCNPFFPDLDCEAVALAPFLSLHFSHSGQHCFPDRLAKSSCLFLVTVLSSWPGFLPTEAL